MSPVLGTRCCGRVVVFGWWLAACLASVRRVPTREPTGARDGSADDGVDVTLAEDHQLASTQVDLGAAVLGEHDGVAHFDFDGFAVAVIEHLARSDGQHLATLAL